MAKMRVHELAKELDINSKGTWRKGHRCKGSKFH